MFGSGNVTSSWANPQQNQQNQQQQGNSVFGQSGFGSGGGGALVDFRINLLVED